MFAQNCIANSRKICWRNYDACYCLVSCQNVQIKSHLHSPKRRNVLHCLLQKDKKIFQTIENLPKNSEFFVTAYNISAECNFFKPLETFIFFMKNIGLTLVNFYFRNGQRWKTFFLLCSAQSRRTLSANPDN